MHDDHLQLKHTFHLAIEHNILKTKIQNLIVTLLYS